MNVAYEACLRILDNLTSHWIQAENTRHRGKYCCTSEWFGFDQTSKTVVHSTKAKQLNTDKINRSAAQWDFLLWRECSMIQVEPQANHLRFCQICLCIEERTKINKKCRVWPIFEMYLWIIDTKYKGSLFVYFYLSGARRLSNHCI